MRRVIVFILCLAGLAWAGRAADESSFTVVTFNIRYANDHDGENAWAVRREKVVQEIERLAPDILGVQEALAPQLDRLLERLPVYAHVGVGRDDGARAGEFAPILYRAERYELLEHGTFWLSDTPEVPGSTSFGNTLPRICTWAVLRDIDADREVLVSNVHLDHQSRPAREKGVALVLDRLAGLREGRAALLLGDFNAQEDSDAVRAALGDARFGFVNSVRASGAEDGVIPTFNGFREREVWADRGMIDYVFVTKKTLDVRGAGVERRVFEDGRYASDHFPVRAELSFR